MIGRRVRALVVLTLVCSGLVVARNVVKAGADHGSIVCGSEFATGIDSATGVRPPLTSAGGRFRFTGRVDISAGCVDTWDRAPLQNSVYDHAAISAAKLTLTLYSEGACTDPLFYVGGKATLRLLDNLTAPTVQERAIFHLNGTATAVSSDTYDVNLHGVTQRRSAGTAFPGDVSIRFNISPDAGAAPTCDDPLAFKTPFKILATDDPFLTVT
jgi:hypothetical protein